MQRKTLAQSLLFSFLLSLDSPGLPYSLPKISQQVFPVPAGLLSSFVEVESIKRHFKSRLVGTVLNGYLCLRKLVLQRTKLIDETQDMLLEMLEDMTTGNAPWQLGAAEVHMCTVSECRSTREWVTNLTLGERSLSQEHCGAQCYSPRAELTCTFPGLRS